MTGRRALKHALPIAILAAIVAGVVWAFSAPLYRQYSLAECLEAYGEARNMRDTMRVDSHPYRNERDNRRIRHRCAEIRAQGDSVLLMQSLRP
jgi:hypothetical protein